jgi:hypothetical protein|uniref:Ycf36 n=1 Tax=Galdieria yellowstonensis TaxID=3028027 RepID=A0A9Y1MXJ1_9RHOD|nr:hypothetical protein GAYEhsy245_016 [Galdieria yellowstonensis]WDA99421.1 hypothetical protein GAYE_10879_016 [Galdieria yellowstonensis]
MLFLCHIKCPVPINQQPLEEYSILIKSKRIFWSLLLINTINKQKCIHFCLLIVLINTLFFIISQNLNLDFFFKFFYLIILSLLVLLIITLKLYLDFSYIGKRLVSAIIDYEESGWYNGQKWVKSPKSLIKERIIAVYKIQPIIDKIKILLTTLSLTISALFFFKIIYYND